MRQAAGVLDPELKEHVGSLVHDVLGSTVLGIDPLQESERGAVLLVELSGSRRLVLTLTGPHPGRPDGTEPAGTDHERTAAVAALAGAAGVPVPPVLAAKNAEGEGGYLLREHVDGIEWYRVRPTLDDHAARSIHRQFAELLLALRTVPLDSFGDLDRQARPAGLDPVDALHRRADLRVADAAARQLFHELLDREAASFDDARPTLVHDDLHSANVVLRQVGGEWRVAGVLDWEKAWAGPEESDVARMAFWDDMTGPGFWEVYRSAVPEDDGYARRALVHQLLWCLEYDVRTPRHERDTAAVCAALGIPSPNRGARSGRDR
jgi:aminoglycoside phosphotransferase (APT) family kinase protein